MPEEAKKQDETKKPAGGGLKPSPAEKPTNCMKCNKRLKRKAWYYKNGGYYCSKGCWQQAVKTAEKKKEKDVQKT